MEATLKTLQSNHTVYILLICSSLVRVQKYEDLRKDGELAIAIVSAQPRSAFCPQSANHLMTSLDLITLCQPHLHPQYTHKP